MSSFTKTTSTSDDDPIAICRFCLDNVDSHGVTDLISPCNCKGGSAYIHEGCLRRWQRMLLVDLPTHPSYWGSELRHLKCTVCSTIYTNPPPTRFELMSSFTGYELATMLRKNRLICCHPLSAQHMKDELKVTQGESESGGFYEKELLRVMKKSYSYWCDSVYVIVRVDDDDGAITMEIKDNDATSKRMLKNLKPTIDVEGREYVLQTPKNRSNDSSNANPMLSLPPSVRPTQGQGPSSESESSPQETKSKSAAEAETQAEKHQNLLSLIRNHPTPFQLEYIDIKGPTSGEDTIIAVSLNNVLNCNTNTSDMVKGRIERTDLKIKKLLCKFGKQWVEQMMMINDEDGDGDKEMEVEKKGGDMIGDDVEILHYIGGPVYTSTICQCIVPGGNGVGWTAVKSLSSACFLLSKRLNTPEDNNNDNDNSTSSDSSSSNSDFDFFSGSKVTLHSLVGAKHLNDEIAVALSFDVSSSRWNVRLSDGKGVSIKPSNLQNVKPKLKPKTKKRGTILVFWGEARWSRNQLLGELARSHWGMCEASIKNVVFGANDPSRIWSDLVKDGEGGEESRILYAPISEMTEAGLREAREEMERLGRNIRGEEEEGMDGDDGDEGSQGGDMDEEMDEGKDDDDDDDDGGDD